MDHKPGAHRIRHPRRGEHWAAVLSGRTRDGFAWRVRRRPLIFWPPLLAVIAYNLAFLAVAPFYCTASSTVGSTSTTICSSIIGLRYTGEGIYNPSLMPAVAVALIFAGLTAIALFAFLLWKRRTRSSPRAG